MKLKTLVEATNAQKVLDKKTLSLEELAKKHDVPVKDLKKQLDKGVKMEMDEHTKGKTPENKEAAKEIALDHLAEDPKYYDNLEDMEEDVEEDVKEGSKDSKNSKKDEEESEDKDDD